MCCCIHRVPRSHQPTPLRTSKPATTDPVPPATANLTVPPKKKVSCMYMLELSQSIRKLSMVLITPYKCNKVVYSQYGCDEVVTSL